MFSDGDDAGHCSNALTAQKFREATPEERITYRKWLPRHRLLLLCVVVPVGHRDGDLRRHRPDPALESLGCITAGGLAARAD